MNTKLSFLPLALVIAAAACGGGDNGGGGTSTPPPPPNGTPGLSGDYPWPVWDGKVPAVQPSTTGKTYYVDGKAGADSNDGSSGSPFKTIKKAVSVVAAGDTVLIHGGFYREGIDLMDAPSGSDGKPITFGSFGDGAPILDGSTAITGWTQANGVWRAPVSFTPIGVVVNETPLKQVRQGQGGSAAPQEGIAGVTPKSGKWGYDAAAKQIVVDFGSVDPNTADVIVPKDSQDQQHVFFSGDWYVFKGLTVRGSGSNGMWGYGSHITIESCDVKFNGKAGISFQVDSGKPATADDSVLTSHVYHNVLINWPRGNNGFAESGGGWPGALSFAYALRPLARGNVVHMNGGEGVIAYGTDASHPSGSATFEQNVIVDNWSVNLYFDNQPNDTARDNIIINHAPDPSTRLYDSPNEPWSLLDKYTVGIMLADEENSSDATNNYANLDKVSVYNNLIAGCRISIRDYSEGDAHANRFHALKNAVIANNTIIMPFAKMNNTDIMGIFLQDNGDRNAGSIIQNNVVYGFNDDPVVWTDRASGMPGVTLDYNAYFSPSGQPFRAADVSSDLAGWRGVVGAEQHSLFRDPLLVDVAHFHGTTPYDWKKADLLPTSPARGAGTPQAAFSDTLSLAKRDRWNIGAL